MFGHTVDSLENPWPSKTLLLPAVFVLLLTIFFIRKLFLSLKPSKNLPPSPPKLPIIGNLHQLGSSPHKTLHRFAEKHGPLMLLHLGSVPFLVISSSEAAREILKTHDPIFSNRPKSSVADAIYDCKDIAFSPYGDYWRRAKSVCVNHLLSGRKVMSFRDVREEEVGAVVEKIGKCCEEKVIVDLSEMVASMANDVICGVALGRKYGDRKFKEIVETLEGVVREHVMVMAERERVDFVDVLLGIQRNADEEDGFVLDAISIKALILDMFAAGTDTTYTLIEWTLSELIRHTNIMSKLKNELKNIAGLNSYISEDDLDKFHYLKVVVKETLRLHPPLPLLVPCESTRDVELLGYDISAGTRVVINVWAIGRDPLLWAEPEKFWPERFVNSSAGLKGQFQFIPFGGCRRVCPGAAFAMVIVELVLANLVPKFEFELPGGEKGEDLDISEGEGITMHRKYPLRVFASCETNLSL